MNEFAEKYKALLKEHEATLKELEKVNEARDMLKKENEIIAGRLQHLLESDYIRRFDEYDLMTHKYALDIRDADNLIKSLDAYSLETRHQQHELEMLKECIARMTMERLGVS